MLEFLTGAILLVGCVTILNLVMLFAVIRRLRLAETNHAPDATLPTTGHRVGRFHVTATDSGIVSDRDLSVGSSVVGFITPGCEPCQSVLDELVRRRAAVSPTDADSRLMIFVVGPEVEAMRFVEPLGASARIALVSEASAVAAAFGGVTGYPTLVRVHDGSIVAAGRNLPSVDDRDALANAGHST